MSLILLCLVIAASTHAAAASKYQLTKDPQAVAVAQAAFTAMGGAQAIAGYQDSLASGTVTISTGGNPVSYPITMKSKGLRETRVELQMPKGTNIRIVNQGQGAIIRPGGIVQALDSNNTFCEHVNHVPILSLLSEYANGTVNLIYQGVQTVNGQSENVIEMDFVPNTDPVMAPIFASTSRTLFFVNQATSLVDKIQSYPLNEGDAHTSVNEEIYFDSYQSVNGMSVPFHLVVFRDGSSYEDVKFSTVNLNVGLADSDFTLPKVGGQ
jgi:hypothetical protein